MNGAISDFSAVVVMVAVGALVVAGMTLLGVTTYRMIKRPRRRKTGA